MTKKDDEPAKGSVWSGLARMEAELQDPEEDETFVYKADKIAELRKAAQAGAAPADLQRLYDDEVEEEPTSRKQFKTVPSSGKQLKLEADAEADADAEAEAEPDDVLPRLGGRESIADDTDTDLGYAELLRVRKARQERPRRDDAEPESAPESDSTVALWVEDPDGVEPARQKTSGSSTRVLWILVVLLTIIAAGVAFVQGRLG